MDELLSQLGTKEEIEMNVLHKNETRDSHCSAGMENEAFELSSSEEDEEKGKDEEKDEKKEYFKLSEDAKNIYDLYCKYKSTVSELERKLETGQRITIALLNLQNNYKAVLDSSDPVVRQEAEDHLKKIKNELSSMREKMRSLRESISVSIEKRDRFELLFNFQKIRDTLSVALALMKDNIDRTVTAEKESGGEN